MNNEEEEAIITAIVDRFASCRSPLESVHELMSLLSFLVYETKEEGGDAVDAFLCICIMMDELHKHPAIEMYCPNDEHYSPRDFKGMFHAD